MVRGAGERVESIENYHAATSLWCVCLLDQSFLSAISVYVRNLSSNSEISDLSERSSNLEEEETEE